MPNTVELRRTYKGGSTGSLVAMPDLVGTAEHEEFHDHMRKYHWEALRGPLGVVDYGDGALEFRNCPLCKTTLAKPVKPVQKSS